jgi:hypothetical protein
MGEARPGAGLMTPRLMETVADWWKYTTGGKEVKTLLPFLDRPNTRSLVSTSLSRTIRCAWGLRVSLPMS